MKKLLDIVNQPWEEEGNPGGTISKMMRIYVLGLTWKNNRFDLKIYRLDLAVLRVQSQPILISMLNEELG